MALYQKSVLNKFLKGQDKETVTKAYKKFVKYFNDPKIQDNIRSSKEEEYQGIFLTELFSKVLDYTMKPNANFNLVAEYKNEKNSKKADGAILKDEIALGVIELKGTNTKDLEAVRQQAFDYKANQTGCVYVITSNFEKLRFYINNAVDFEEFDLFNLSEERFNLLYLCLAKENLLNNIPLKIKEASIQEEEAITKKFYNDYSQFKRELFRDLVKLNMKNDVFRAELNREDAERANKNIKHNLFKKSQKLIDRYLFIFFAEDRGLLPPNSTLKILEQWDKLKDLDAYAPLYDRYKLYFNYLDTGRKGTDKTAEIFAYNGGLFKPDAILDSLKISDELLYKHTKALSHYDFESQVDVNILGHIFENSLNEIESVNAEIEGTDFDKQTTKRKKDGVFYTPKYITKYIVDNTVGKLCNEKKTELGVIEEEYLKSRKGRSKAKLKDLLDGLEAYREWLLQITILDPACGSGAFLNQALDFLIKEHQYIDELQTNLLGGGFVFPDIENTVLENNIFGVDINEESVEIAKLSLWLRTAQPRRKLNDLSNNIKCGNSLIDSKNFAGDKAFKWEEEYSNIFEKGGFDVVIGNPPYVRHEVIKDYKPAFQKVYETYLSTADLYVYFIELGIKLLKENGVLGFINPNKFIKASYGKNLKSFLSRFQIEQLIDFGELNVFQDAVTSPLILLVAKTDFIKTAKYLQIKSLENLDISISLANESISLKPNIFNQETWNLISEEELSILDKVSKSGVSISDDGKLDIKYGLKTGLNEAFIVSEETKNAIIKKDSKSANLFKKFIDGDDVRKYNIRSKNKHLICMPSGFTNKQGDFTNEEEAWLWLNKNYRGVANYLEQFESKAKKRSDKGNYWWELRACDYYNLIDEAKIIYPEIAMSSRFAFDDSGIYINKTIFLINSSSYSLLGLLNSKLIWFYLINTCASLGDPKNGGRLNMQRIYLETISLPNTFELGDSILGKKAIIINSLHNDFNALISKLLDYTKSQHTGIIIPKKLQTWHELEFGDFIKELNKAIKKAGGTPLTKIQEMDWMDVFETKKAEAQTLKAEIDKTDAEIDAMVYELYGLTEDEIKIVEES
jgi:hypothetical protein